MPYGLRKSGARKGLGYFGELPMTDNSGRISTELSINVDDKEIPSLVPTLDDDEVAHMLSGGKPTKQIVKKAAEHAAEREKQGTGPYAEIPEVGALVKKKSKYRMYKDKQEESPE